MSRSLPLAAVAVTTAGILLAAPPPAGADGLPVLGIDSGPEGVLDVDGAVRYVSLAHSSGTTVAAVQADGGRVTASTMLGGPFTIPAVALDGTADGLSHDGRTLVLIRPRASFPRASTRFAVLDTEKLRVTRRIRLRGDFSFDALSPDGRTTYLIRYTHKRDPTRYEVLRMSTRTGRLNREPIVDPYEPDEDMRGFPVTRVTSEDGRWAYTLYDGGGAHPFVHALDTVGATARCIDLDALSGRPDLAGLRLRLDRKALRVISPDGVDLLDIDRRTLAVTASERTASFVGMLVQLGLSQASTPAH